MIAGMATVKRPYRSGIRRGDAPRLICEAAARLFATKGYLATSVDDIAAEAGVARPTVFTAVGPKPVILKTVFDQAMAGDDVPAPIAERPWWTEALDEPDPASSIELHVRNMCWISQRSAALARAVETAAEVDDDAAELWAQYQLQKRVGMASFVANLANKTELRLELDAIVDTMWALSPDAYWRLVHETGWPVETYQLWLTDLLRRLILE